MLTTPLLAAKSLHGHSGAPIGWEKIVMNNVKRICSCDSLNPSMEPTAPCFLWWKKCVSPSGFPLNRPMETPRHVHVHVRSCQFSQGSTPTQCRVATLSGTLKLCSWARHQRLVLAKLSETQLVGGFNCYSMLYVVCLGWWCQLFFLVGIDCCRELGSINHVWFPGRR